VIEHESILLREMLAQLQAGTDVMSLVSELASFRPLDE
jgi:hypothetical protein